MEMEQRDSGLIVTKKTPERRYGILEIQEEENRAKAKDAFNLLWDALELTGVYNVGPLEPQSGTGEAHKQFYHFFAEMLLGEDQPEHEVWT